jgi:ribosomal RNA-processing protein 36
VEASDNESNNGDDFKASLADISFGALAKAQASLREKKRNSKHTKEPSTATSTVDEIRTKLREAREQKAAADEKAKRKEKKSRSSKHAPMEQSSKRAVTRKRTAVELPPAPRSRDPRFDAAVMGHSGVGKHPHGGKAYAFLDEYRASELKELKETMRKTKNPQQKEKIKAEVRRMEDKMRSAANKKREADVVAEHKKKEKQLIREGKKATPYYLKNSELQKQVLEKKYEEMGSRERSKALERRRRKMASKERKEMPWERRGFEGGGGGGGEDGGVPNGGKRRRLE